MELIYAYIDNFRTFNMQNISFSNKFIVEYSRKENYLSIVKNENYFDIYPGNVVGISAIVGKNATGKTSLLSLIGEKIDDRHSKNEIFEKKLESPHEKITLLNLKVSKGIKSLRYTSKYFMLYYYGKSELNEDLFIFETNCPKAFIKLFKNYKCLTDDNANYGPPINYFIVKGWFSCVFKIVDSQNIYLADTQSHKHYNTSPQLNTSIIFFKNGYYQNFFERTAESDEESKISIKRRYSSFKIAYFYNQLNFLIQQIQNNIPNKTLFKNHLYKVNISFADTYPSAPENEPEIDFSEVLKDYRNFSLELFSEDQKITLAFLYSYTCYIFTTIIFSHGEMSVNQKIIVTQLKKIWDDSSSYKDIKGLYHQQINLILNSLGSEYLLLSEFVKAEKSLEEFFQVAKGCNLKYTYTKNNLTLEVCKDSKLEKVKRFFDHCIDEHAIKNLNKTDSVLHEFVNTSIQCLSDGEKENLSMFTAIHEQISLHLMEKQRYILLFDEIERSMHPEMCRCLISDLISFLVSYPKKEFQVIIASHSPFITGDIRKENIICLSREEEKSTVFIPQSSTFGQNIHTTLKTQFFLESTFGEYFSKLLELIINSINTTEPKELIKIINDFLNDPNCYHEKRLIQSLPEAINFLEETISSIGEPLIRSHLQELLFEKKDSYFSVEEKIKYYQDQISKLQKEEPY